MMNTNMNMMIKLVYVDAENTGDSLRKNDQLHYQEDVNMSEIEQENVGVLWRELQQQWITFKEAESKKDEQTMVSTARRIQDIQDDLGLTVCDFGDLEVDIRILRNKSK